MPRTRGKKRTRKPKKTEKIEKSVRKEFPLEEYGLSILQGFMRARDRVIAVAYRLQTGDIADEDIVNKYRSMAITALQTSAKRKGYTVSVQHIHFQSLPLGEETIIKAFASFKDSVEYRQSVQRGDPFAWGVEKELEE